MGQPLLVHGSSKKDFRETGLSISAKWSAMKTAHQQIAFAGLRKLVAK